MKRIAIIFLCLYLSGAVVILAQEAALKVGEEEKLQHSWMPEGLQKISLKLAALEAQIKAIDEYAPEKSPDFKNLERINQLVDQLEFNTRKFDLLIKKYNVIEEELFGYLLETSLKDATKVSRFSQYLRKYKKRGENSFLNFQKEINRVALLIERIQRDISKLQLKAKSDALESESGKESKVAAGDLTITERIKKAKGDLGKNKSALTLENAVLTDLKKVEKEQIDKISEKKAEVAALREKAKKSRNLVEKLFVLIRGEVIEERLNGLEILKLNTKKAHIYLINTKIDTLKEKIEKNESDILFLKELRNAEIRAKVIKGVIIVLIAFFMAIILIRLSRLVSRKIIKRIEKSEQIDDHKKQRYQTLSSVILSFVKILIWAIAVFWTLGELEVDYGPFLVAAGGISLAIGFGAQSLVKDIVTGFFLLIEEQFALGDFVEINGKSGTVEKISLRTIKFRSLDGTIHIIPNGNISFVSNSTYKWSRAVVKVDVSYNDDPDKVFKALGEICDRVYEDPKYKDIILEKPSTDGILSFNDSSISYRIKVKTVPGSQWGLEREINLMLKSVLDREGIDIPYNYINLVDMSPKPAE